MRLNGHVESSNLLTIYRTVEPCGALLLHMGIVMKTLSTHQEDVINKIIHWFGHSDKPYFYLSGYAGTGKTTLIPHIIERCKLPIDAIELVAPTGKAANVISEKLLKDGIVKRARTIHSAIYTPSHFAADVIRAKIEDLQQRNTKDIYDADKKTTVGMVLRALKQDLRRAEKSEAAPEFVMNAGAFSEDTGLIIVDEASMVGLEMAEDLMSFGIPIIAIGDPMQLPPIGKKGKDAPQGFMMHAPDASLTEIHRQALDNPIMWLSLKLRETGIPVLPYGDHGNDVRVIKRRYDNVTYDLDRDLQLICGTHATRFRVTNRIRRELGIDTDGPQKDEPLMVMKNCVQDKRLVNGTPAYCDTNVGTLIDGNDQIKLKFTALVDGNPISYTRMCSQSQFEAVRECDKYFHSLASNRENNLVKRKSFWMDFGYQITCHKSQGSQWEEVCVHDESNAFGENAVRWAYTALTRAEKRMTWVS